VCSNLTFCPHSNECGPRCLLALAVMMLHPTPHPQMLMPYMHPNLTQEARCWVASSILQGIVNLPICTPIPSRTSHTTTSRPMSFINWASTTHLPSPICPITVTSPLHETTALQCILSPGHSSQVFPLPVKHKANFPHCPSSKACLAQHPSLSSPTSTKIPTSPLPNTQTPIPTAVPTNTSRASVHIAPRTIEERHQDTSSFQRKVQRKPKPLVQTKLFPDLHLLDQQEHEPTWGHSLETIVNSSTFQVILQNPNGINIYNNSFHYKHGLSVCRSLAAGAVCVSETKLNTNHTSILDKL
jgi:hypothetical protein